MSRRVRTVLIALLVVGAGAVMAREVTRVVERRQTLNEINRLRDELYAARVASDRCRGSLVNSESALRDLGLAIDSLRRTVDRFEALDERGVPADRYDEYMAAFDAYNDSVAAWDVRTRRLRTAEESCRNTIRGHNELSDSLQRVLEAAGLDTE